MLKIGVTGGIGSGKSVVVRVFKVLGIPVLDADALAKELMENDIVVKKALLETFGNDIFLNGRLQRKQLARVVFNDSEKLDALNGIVHPAVLQYGEQWAERQHAPYIIKEAALFFESQSNRHMDKIIGVSAPFDMRLQRAMQRDGVSEEEVLKRMKNQMDEDEKMKQCDYVIHNDETTSIIQQVLYLHHEFLKIKQ